MNKTRPIAFIVKVALTYLDPPIGSGPPTSSMPSH